MTQPLLDRDRASIATRGSGRPALGMGMMGTSDWVSVYGQVVQAERTTSLQCRRRSMLRMAIQSRTTRSGEAGCESQPQRSHESVG